MQGQDCLEKQVDIIEVDTLSSKYFGYATFNISDSIIEKIWWKKEEKDIEIKVGNKIEIEMKKENPIEFPTEDNLIIRGDATRGKFYIDNVELIFYKICK